MFAWAIVVSAVLAGLYARWRYPAGVLLHTPRDACQDRTHTFGLGYLGVLATAAAVFALVCLASVVVRAVTTSPQARATLTAWARTSLLSVGIFAVAMLATPLFELSMPLQPDPKCVASRPPAKR